MYIIMLYFKWVRVCSFSLFYSTGYEVDQVTHMGPQKGSTTSSGNLGGFSCYPDCEDGDKSVPIYNAYNHHYFGNGLKIIFILAIL